MALTKFEDDIYKMFGSTETGFHSSQVAKAFGKKTNWASTKLDNLVTKGYLVKVSKGLFKPAKRKKVTPVLTITGKPLSRLKALETGFKLSNLYFQGNEHLQERLNLEIFSVMVTSDNIHKGFNDKFLLNKFFADVLIQKTKCKYGIPLMKAIPIDFPRMETSWLHPSGVIDFQSSFEFPKIFLEADLKVIASRCADIELVVTLTESSGDKTTYLVGSGQVKIARKPVVIEKITGKSKKEVAFTELEIMRFLKKPAQK